MKINKKNVKKMWDVLIMKNHNNNKIKIDFSLKREIFFVVIGAIIGISR